jgi:hypothetical protein
LLQAAGLNFFWDILVWAVYNYPKPVNTFLKGVFMRTKSFMLLCLLAAFALVAAGCGKKTDENKSISQVQAEAGKMSVEQLRTAALECKNALMAKKGELAKLEEKVKMLTSDKIISGEGQKLTANIQSAGKSIADLSEQLKIYVNKIKEKGGDISGLNP